MDNEKLKIWLNFTKFLLGSCALGFVTLIVNSAIQDREISLKEQEHLATFTQEALKENVGPRRLLAQYFAAVTQSEDLREGWIRYLNIVEKEYQYTENRKIEKDQEVAKLEETLEEIREKFSIQGEEQNKNIRQLEKKLAFKSAERDNIQAQLDISTSTASTPTPGPYANLRGANLRGANLQAANLYGANFGGADLEGANLFQANLKGANLSRARLLNTDLGSSSLKGANFLGANLKQASLDVAHLVGANFQAANLEEADLYKANLKGANLKQANLLGANLQGAILLKVKKLTLDQLSEAETLYEAILDPELVIQVKEKYPHLLEKYGGGPE